MLSNRFSSHESGVAAEPPAKNAYKASPNSIRSSLVCAGNGSQNNEGWSLTAAPSSLQPGVGNWLPESGSSFCDMPSHGNLVVVPRPQASSPLFPQFGGPESPALQVAPRQATLNFPGESPSVLGNEFLSVGSLQHARGICKPCLFWYRGLCHKNWRCDFCHIPHDLDTVRRVRPSKKTRNILLQAPRIYDVPC